MFNHHQGSIRYVNTDFNDRGSHQQLDFIGDKFRHHRVFFCGFHASVHQAHTQIGEGGLHQFEGIHRGLQLQGFGFFNQRAHPVGLCASLAGQANAFENFLAATVRNQARLDRCAAWRQLVNYRDIEVGEITHRQGARNRRGTHHQLVRFLFAPAGRLALAGICLLAQGQALTDTEAMLLIDDRQPQLGETYSLLKQRMGADGQLRTAGGNRSDRLAFVLCFQTAGQPGDGNAQWRQQLRELAKVLLGEDLRWRHQRGLITIVDGLRSGQGGHDRFAAAHIALQQPLHGMRCGKLGGDFVPAA